jgi:hypothetical protein
VSTPTSWASSPSSQTTVGTASALVTFISSLFCVPFQVASACDIHSVSFALCARNLTNHTQLYTLQTTGNGDGPARSLWKSISLTLQIDQTLTRYSFVHYLRSPPYRRPATATAPHALYGRLCSRARRWSRSCNRCARRHW